MKGQMGCRVLAPQTPIKFLIFGPCCKMILGMALRQGLGTSRWDSHGFQLEHRMLSVTLGTGKVVGKGFISTIDSNM